MLEVTKVLMPTSKYSIKCPYTMEPEGITIHNTANDASAMAEVSYMINNNNQVSFHEAVDDYRVVQGIEHNRNSWNAGDGHGFGNMKTISIEICYSKSGGERFDLAERNGAKRVAYLMKEYGWGLDKIADERNTIGTHEDRCGKYCPHRTLDYGLDRFYNMVVEEYYNLTGEVPVGEPTEEPADEVEETVADIQRTLNERYGFDIVVDNIAGSQTKGALVRALQIELNEQYNKGVVVDGIFGNQTKDACITLRKGAEGNITWIMQARLACLGYDIVVDSDFGYQTDTVVKRFQRNKGTLQDGVVGKVTWGLLFK